jgi:hypothetical protein
LKFITDIRSCSSPGVSINHAFGHSFYVTDIPFSFHTFISCIHTRSRVIFTSSLTLTTSYTTAKRFGLKSIEVFCFSLFNENAQVRKSKHITTHIIIYTNYCSSTLFYTLLTPPCHPPSNLPSNSHKQHTRNATSTPQSNEARNTSSSSLAPLAHSIQHHTCIITTTF